MFRVYTILVGVLWRFFTKIVDLGVLSEICNFVWEVWRDMALLNK